MISKIVAIGGGEIGRPGFSIETMEIDKEIIKLTEKSNPHLLFIPTASGDSSGYCEVVENYFGKKLGCKVSHLLLLKGELKESDIREKILSADIIYVGGGNTLRMMKVWRKNGVDVILKEAYEKGIVLSGLSAGAICWFKYGNSDSLKMKDKEAPLIRVAGLNLVNASFCPHYNVEESRKSDLEKMMKKTPGVALAFDNCAAIEIVGERYRIIASKEDANAHRVFWSKNTLFHEVIPKKEEYLELSHLLDKSQKIC